MVRQATATTIIQLLKYGVIGASNTLITLAAFYVMNTLLGLPYGLSNATGYVLGVVNSFVWNRRWVFKTGGNFWREAGLFVGGFLLCWMLQGLVSLILLEGCGMKNMAEIPWLPMKNTGQNIVMVIGMVFYTLANYAYNRFVTFRVKKSDHESSELSKHSDS